MVTTPPSSFVEFCKFYKNRKSHYAEILNTLEKADDLYSKHYRSGGYNYEPEAKRSWLMKNTSLPQHTGTCLDVGSGDGFWSWILAEWYDVTGIEPVEGAVTFSNAIRQRLPKDIQDRTNFIVGDALEVSHAYDTVFCRAPSFLNYPLHKPFSIDLLDTDRSKIKQLWSLSLPPQKVQQLLDNYPPGLIGSPAELYSTYCDQGNKYIEKMLSITNKYFIFMISSSPQFRGEFAGDTYNHEPNDVKKSLSVYGDTTVTVVDGSMIVAEVFL